MKVTIMGKDQFQYKVLNNFDKYDSNEYFFISILEPEFNGVLKEDSENYRTYKFYDIDVDCGNFKAVSYETTEEIREFILANYGKHLIVHCSAGIARSSAVAEFYHELLGGSYKELLETNPCILPNPTVLYYLRTGQSSN